MQTNEINRLISRAIAEDNRTNKTRDILKAGFRQLGQVVTGKQLTDLVQFIQAYVKNVPSLLEQVAKAASEKGIGRQIAPMLNMVEQYFLEPNDFIPDHLGLIGLVDDAYLGQRLIEVLSENYWRQTGTRLVNVDLSQGNNIIRNLLGEPLVGMLDTTVMNTIQMPDMQQFMQNLMNFQGMMPMSAPHPEYGMMSAREIADLRLGAMGVV